MPLPILVGIGVLAAKAAAVGAAAGVVKAVVDTASGKN